MQLRFVSWNMHGKRQLEGQLGLLRHIAGDLVALQEVSANAYSELVANKPFAWSAFSLDLRPPLMGEGMSRRLGCAVFGQHPFRLRKHSLLEQASFPERALVVEVDSPSGPLSICSFHAPPGVNWKERKPQAFMVLTEWLATHPERTLVGMDANAPKTDHPDITQNQWWWKEEPLLLGARPLHNLNDVLRTWLAAHPIEAEQLYTLRPQGPLAISYDRGKKSSIPCRYDFIYVTPDFTVTKVDYLYCEALEAGSDHALVVAELHYVSNHANSFSTDTVFSDEIGQRSPTDIFREDEFTSIVSLGGNLLKEREVD